MIKVIILVSIGLGIWLVLAVLMGIR